MGLASDGEWKEWLKHDFDSYCKEYRVLSQETQALLTFQGFCNLKRKRSGSKKKKNSIDAYWDKLVTKVNGHIESPISHGQEDEASKKEQGNNALLIEKMSFSSNIRMRDIVTKKGVIKKKQREDSDLHFGKSNLRSHQEPLKEQKEGISPIKVPHHYPPSMHTCREEKEVLNEENEREKHASPNSEILSL
ncbi:hypothetical protein KI387_016364 [Taxus chinensis]|uniref:Uncharacterized protein n=1 Tax=Taxus chinensis TaxID=29808 RepID=A0AA38LGS6_TAXCH|nr:hypothetical protein KI387_016364 [Taxus chinensis]